MSLLAIISSRSIIASINYSSTFFLIGQVTNEEARNTTNIRPRNFDLIQHLDPGGMQDQNLPNGSTDPKIDSVCICTCPQGKIIDTVLNT